MRALTWMGALALTGCLGTPGVHPTLHPSQPGTGNSGGIAIGAGIQTGDSTGQDSTNTMIGYGEGWVRIGPGGALELRTTPQGGFLSYDIALTSGKTPISIRPAVGASILRFTDDNGMNSDTEMVMYLQPGAALVINSGSLYVAPRFGLGLSTVLSGNGEGETAFTGAVTGGVRFGSGYSFELSILYSRGEENAAGNAPDAWTFVPSFGISVP